MKYINIKTGVVHNFSCQVSGGDWQPVETASEPLSAETAKKPARQPKKKDVRK